MKIDVNGLSVNIICPSSIVPQDKIPIMFLHGFTGSASDWEYVIENIDERFFPIAIDLPGHGETEISNDLNDYSITSIINIISNVIRKLKLSDVVLVGYSMGGRAALSFALQHKTKIKALILESTTAGIKDSTEREERYKNDIDLAERIEKQGIANFVEYWMELTLFESLKTLPQSIYKNIIQKKIKNSEKGLANSLRGFSTGKMKNLWDVLETIDIPIFLITGALDEKYTRISLEMEKLISQSDRTVVKNIGHNVHLEKPKEFIKLVNNFLDRLL